jgi:hypothetical protein
MLNKYYSWHVNNLGEFRDSDHPPTSEIQNPHRTFDFETLLTADSLLRPETSPKHSRLTHILYIMCIIVVVKLLSCVQLLCDPTRLLCPWDFPGKSTGMGCHSLPQGMFPTQGWDLQLLFGRWILYTELPGVTTCHMANLISKGSLELFCQLQP